MTIEEAHLKAIHQFASSSEIFCDLLRNHLDVPDEEFPTQCAAAMAALYRDVLALPQYDDFSTDEYVAARALTTISLSDEYFCKSLFERLDAQQHDLYWLYFDPFDSTSNLSTPLYMTLWEIYENIRQGLEVYRLGTDFGLRYASDYWKGMFLVHWGQHLTDALRAMHEIIYQDYSKPSLAQAVDDDEHE